LGQNYQFMSLFSFHKKNIKSQETLGEKFRKLRLGKNWTLEVAAEKTKIAAHYLQSLEKSRYDDIPGEVYITNFIKVYEQKLGVEPGKCLEQYRLERHIIELKKHHRFLPEIGQSSFWEKILKPKNIKLAAICAIILVVLSYIILNVYQTVTPPKLTIFYPASDLEVSDPVIKVTGQSEKEALVTINNQEILLTENGKFEETISLRIGLNLLVISAKKRHGWENKIERHILVNTQKPVVKY